MGVPTSSTRTCMLMCTDVKVQSCTYEKHVNIRSMRSETDIHVLSCGFTYMYVYMHIYMYMCVSIISYRMYIFYVFAQIHVCI